MMVCALCGSVWTAGHPCTGPKGTPLERARKKLETRYELSDVERKAVLAALAEASS